MQLNEAGIRKVATKVTTTLNCLEGAVQAFAALGPAEEDEYFHADAPPGA